MFGQINYGTGRFEFVPPFFDAVGEGATNLVKVFAGEHTFLRSRTAAWVTASFGDTSVDSEVCAEFSRRLFLTHGLASLSSLITIRRYFGPYRIPKRISPVTYDVLPEPPYQTRPSPKPEMVLIMRPKSYVPRWNTSAVEDDDLHGEEAMLRIRRGAG